MDELAILKFYIFSFLILIQAVEAQKKFGNAKAISSDQFFEGQKFDVSASFLQLWNWSLNKAHYPGPFLGSSLLFLSLFSNHRKNWFAARCECLHLIKKNSQCLFACCEFVLIRCSFCDDWKRGLKVSI